MAPLADELELGSPMLVKLLPSVASSDPAVKVRDRGTHALVG